MGAITIIKYKKNDKKIYTKYITTLPKEIMDLINPKKKDKLIFLSENKGILTFKFERHKK